MQIISACAWPDSMSKEGKKKDEAIYIERKSRCGVSVH